MSHFGGRRLLVGNRDETDAGRSARVPPRGPPGLLAIRAAIGSGGINNGPGGPSICSGSRRSNGLRIDPKIITDIADRHWLVTCCVVTDDFRGTGPGQGPSGAEAQPSEHPTRHRESGQSHSEADQEGIPPTGEADLHRPAWAATPTPSIESPIGPTPDANQERPTKPPWPAPEAPIPQAPIPQTPIPQTSTPQTPAFQPAAFQPSIIPAPRDPLDDPYGLGPDPWDARFTPGGIARPRIEPSPPPTRRRLLRGLLIGLTCGLLLFGAGGFILGRVTASPTPSPTPSNALPVYEQSQLAINKPKFPASLAALAQGWLPYLSGCARSGQSGGPTLNAGEKVRVRCSLDGMSAIFVEYATATDRDKARVAALGQNVDARTLTPGAAAPAERRSPSGRTTGNYVEYAYKLTEGGADRIVGGIRWEDDRGPVAAHLLAFWTDGVGSSWAPMRDLWGRYA